MISGAATRCEIMGRHRVLEVGVHKSLIVMIHGLGGDATTWGDFPTLLRADEQISLQFNIQPPYTYSTTARGKGPRIDELALELATTLESGELADARRIVIVAHSMGGLIARRYIVDQLLAQKPHRATRLLTFATPHLGSQWASSGSYVPTTGPQMEDLAVGSQFMNRLGLDWLKAKADDHVESLRILAGDDGVVGAWSATAGYRTSNFQIIKQQGHVSITKPTSAEAPAFELLKTFLLDGGSTKRAIPNADWRQPLLQLRHVADKHENRFLYSSGKTRLYGRKKEFARLMDFVAPSNGLFRWTLVRGAGGAGKSRLAFELARTLVSSGEWYAGFLNSTSDAPDWSRWLPIIPTLLIVDYAATEIEQLRALLPGLADRNHPASPYPHQMPVRLILLERGPDADWIRDAVREGATARPIHDSRDQDIVVDGLDDPWELMSEVLTAMGKPLPDRNETLSQLSEIDPQMRPLYAYLFADAIGAAHEDGGVRLAQFDRKRLIADVINRERSNFWRHHSITLKEERTLAVAIMAGGIAAKDLQNDTSLISKWDIDRHPVIFSLMTGISARDWVPPLEPDIVGEHFVAQIFSKTKLSNTDQDGLCRIAWQLAPAKMAKFALRAHDDVDDIQALAPLRTAPDDPEAIYFWASLCVRLFRSFLINHRSVAEAMVTDLCAHHSKYPMWLFNDYIAQCSADRQQNQALATRLLETVANGATELVRRRDIPNWNRFAHLLTYCGQWQRPLEADKIISALSSDEACFVEKLRHTSLLEIGRLADIGYRLGQNSFSNFVYKAAEQLQLTSGDIFNKQLHDVGQFVRFATNHGKHDLVENICNTLLANPERLAQWAKSAHPQMAYNFTKSATGRRMEEIADLVKVAHGNNLGPRNPMPIGSNHSSNGTPTATARSITQSTRASRNAARNSQLVAAIRDATVAGKANASSQIDSLLPSRLNPFLRWASSQGCDDVVDYILDWIARNPGRTAQRLLESSVGETGRLLRFVIEEDKLPYFTMVAEALIEEPHHYSQWVAGGALGDVAEFLKAAAESGQHRLLGAAYGAMHRELGRIAESAIQVDIGRVAELIGVILDHNQTDIAKTLCMAIVDARDEFVLCVLSSPLIGITNFVRVTKRVGLEGDVLHLLCATLSSNEQWHEKMSGARPSDLRGLLISISHQHINMCAVLLSSQRKDEWEYGEYRSEKFSVGAAGLAASFIKFSRPDLSVELSKNILQRGRREDFSYAPGALTDMATLVELTRTGFGKDPMDDLLDKIISDRWLKNSVSAAKDSDLADALTRLAVNGTPTVMRKFWCQWLYFRLRRANIAVRSASRSEIGGGVRLFGAGALIGRPCNFVQLDASECQRLVAVAADVVANTNDELSIERQRQFWIGVRVLADRLDAPLQLQQDLVERALQFWKNQLGSWGADPSLVSNWISKSMVEWLSSCAINGRGDLQPSIEPIWWATGHGEVPRDFVVRVQYPLL